VKKKREKAAKKVSPKQPKMYGGGYPQDISSETFSNSAAHHRSTEAHEAGHKRGVWAFGSGKQDLAQYIPVILDELPAMEQDSEPPQIGEYLLYLFVSKIEREVIFGDLTEEYPTLVAKFGQKWAQVYFYKQVVWSIWPLFRKAIIKWGLFGWVVEFIRRISS